MTSANLIAPNIFSPNAARTPGTKVSTLPPANGALYNQDLPPGFMWIVPSTGQIFVYMGGSTWKNLSTSTAVNQPITWTVTNSSQGLTSNNGYQVFGSVTPVTLTLPVTSAVGDVIQIASVTSSAGGSPLFPGFTIAQNAGQQILASPLLYTTLGQSGYLSCPVQGANLTLLCVAANLTWNVIGPSMSNFNLN